MKTVILASKLTGEIMRVFGDFNDARRNKADLREYLDVGQEVRCGRRGNYKPWTIVKVGKKSFEVSPLALGATAVITFIVTKAGHVYERGTTNDRYGYHYDISFDCERIDARMAKNAENEIRAQEAIDLGREVTSMVSRLTPFSVSYTVAPESIEKLKAIKAILES